MKNIKFPKIRNDESFEFLVYFEISRKFDLDVLEKYISDWFIMNADEEIFGRSLKEEFQVMPKAKLNSGKLVLQFLGSPSQKCNWPDRRWKDWFVKLVSELLESKLEVIKLIECENANNI